MRFGHEITSACLELIHSDIAGPFPHMSMSQAKYVLTFIDEFSSLWFTSLNSSLKFFTTSRFLRPWLRTSLGGNSRSSDLIMVVNMSSLCSLNIVKMQVSKCNTLFLTHLNIMVLLRGRMESSRRWLLV